jgi:hypothetical protein
MHPDAPPDGAESTKSDKPEDSVQPGTIGCSATMQTRADAALFGRLGILSHPVATFEHMFAVRDVSDGRPALDDLRRRIVEGAAEAAAHMAMWLGMVAEFDEREGWAEDGARSLPQWLAWRCGLDGRTARQHARVAGQLRELPRIAAEFRAGKLSYSKVRAVCRVATAENEELLLELASNLTATQLDRAVTAYDKAHRRSISLNDEAERRARCGIRQWTDSDGLTYTEIVTAPEDTALVQAGVDFGRDGVFKSTGTAAKGAAGRLDALLFVIRRGLVNAERPGLVDESPYLIITHVKEASAFCTDDGQIDLGDGTVVHPRVLQRLGCDALLQAMLEGLDGRPLDLGRTTRTATKKQKRALMAMFSHCDWPGCDVAVRYCEFHHLDFWGKGGNSDLDVFRPLCRHHHSKVHEGGWRFLVDHLGRTVAFPPDGRDPLVPAPALTDRAVGPDELVARNRSNGQMVDGAAVAVEGGSLGGWSQGDAMDRWALGAIVDALFGASSPSSGSASASRSGSRSASAVVDDQLTRGGPPSPN